MADSSVPFVADDIVAALIAAVGAEAVLTGEAAALYSIDVYRRLDSPLAVVSPKSVDDLCAAVRTATSAGLAVFPRGGGASYTDGYLPNRRRSIVVDLGRLDQIVEINEEDAFVTVEAGVTWAALKDALDARGLRTPFFGPFSGLRATIGGSVSQNSISHGSGAHGVSAQSVLGLDIVIASGDVLRTGSAAIGASPFARFFGPDLAGVFTGDCGALGIKARITLPLLRRKAAFGCASFAFLSLPDLAKAMRLAAMEGLDDEHFAIDAALAQGQIARQSAGVGAVIGMAKAVLRSSPSLLGGVVQLAKMAASGAKALRSARYMLHVIVEGVSDAEVKSKLARLRQLMVGGREIPNSIPTVVRGVPFAPFFSTLGPKGERWVPLHGVLPHSKVVPFHNALEAFYAARADEMKRLGVWTGSMFETVNSSGLLYEIAIYWPGPQTEYHRAVVPDDYLRSLPAYPDNAEVSAFVETLKTDLVALFGQFGAVHFQLGKMYPYAARLAPETLSLVRAIKAQLDPDRLMNPGALGL
jgi:FAD/FMN-containing dehydrogenase